MQHSGRSRRGPRAHWVRVAVLLGGLAALAIVPATSVAKSQKAASPQANDLSYRAYQDMFGLARQLADAFGATAAARLPTGGAQTGGGGTAPGPR